jgi:hypothetical protein
MTEPEITGRWLEKEETTAIKLFNPLRNKTGFFSIVLLTPQSVQHLLWLKAHA